MSARSHVDVNERRLRPIYDCLDNGNNKKALQEADKVLKKQKDLQCAKVLKALALLRLGRHDESIVLLDEVHAQKPTEESTLMAMGIAYRELNKMDLIADMYENANSNRPDNEEILSALFMAYVRLSDYKKQQQTAMKLHRLRPAKNPYYFWAIMSIVMQAHMDKKLAKPMYLPLAERMASKYMAEDKIDAEAEVQMYLIVLEELGKYEEALKLVSGPLGDKLTSDPRFQRAKEAELLVKVERWPEANCAYKMLLQENNDDWSHYEAYFNTAFEMIKSKWNPPEEPAESYKEPDHTAELIATFIKAQIETASTMHYMPRGPFLAQLLFHKKLREHDTTVPEIIGSVEDILRQYLAKFGDRPCCFADLQLFLDLLTTEQIEKIVADLTAELNMESQSKDLVFAQDPKTMQRHLSLLQIAQSGGLHDKMSHEEKIALTEQLIQRYKAGLSLGEKLSSTDLQYSDNYLLLACHIMVDIYRSNGDRRLLWKSIVLLEKALVSSPSNFQMKLFLIRLYSFLGCVGPCLRLYESLEIKYIQTDSLGYTVVNHLCRLGHFNAASSIFGTMLRFFTVNHKDTTEYLTASYKFGSFAKINEFVQFRQRLQNSLQYAHAQAERMLMDLTQETTSHQLTERMQVYMDIDPVTDKTAWDDIRDNRDLRVMLNWDPPARILSEEHIEQSFNEEMAWLRIRKLTLRCLSASIKVTEHLGANNNSVGNGTANMGPNYIDVLRGLMGELCSHVKHCEDSLPALEYPVCGPSPTRLISYIKGNYANTFFNALDVLFYVHSLQEVGLEKADKEKEEKMELLSKDLRGHMEEAHGSLLRCDKEGTAFDPSGLESLVHTAELLSHLSIIVGACHRMLKPLKAPIAKKNKKKRDNPPALPPTFNHFNTCVKGLVEVAQKADAGLAAVDMELLSAHLQSISIGQLDTDDKKFESELRTKVLDSYEQSVKEVRHLINTKNTYLSALNL